MRKTPRWASLMLSGLLAFAPAWVPAQTQEPVAGRPASAYSANVATEWFNLAL